ncbi:hypothetical protein BDW02DRAFT_575741 [Decorospora gaudefroyi]|uniref:Uncharacterized protein n=1 Tax=Decorospora gaudefroyi TaxID=184978 RepID=A0A6A5KZH0_9PLEO|nr:hypothetical protein BDW02DRAFT_575741 [Decorospora gaudefroyi]
MADESLYIVKRTLLDPKNPAQPLYNTVLPATYTDLKAAKEHAKTALQKEGYEPEFFPVYREKGTTEDWEHGDGVVIYAEGPSEEVLKVEIDTVPNLAGVKADSTGRVTAPLHHVLQTVIEYNNDRSGSRRYSIVEGTYTSAQLARDRALQVLLDGGMKKEEFIEYDEYVDGTEGPFGPDVIVHAVYDGGMNVLVSVISSN